MTDAQATKPATPRGLPTREAAERLGVRADTMRKWASDGRGPLRPVKVGGRLRWLEADVHALLGVK